MTGSPVGGFLEFFILEASDYGEQLDGVLLRSGAADGPDADAMQRVARALRGTATMAKIPAFADLAGGVERVGKAIQEGAVRWEPAVNGALVAAIDDLKTLLRAARSWSPADEERAATRAAELARYAPARPAGTPANAQQAASRTSASPGGAGGSGPSPANAFLATEAANIAAGLELLATRAGDADTAANVLRRVRALRGVAGVKEIEPLTDVLEATEDAARSLESGGPMSPEARQLLESAAAHLRTLSNAIRTGGSPDAPSATRDAFAAALDAWMESASDRERVVPIEALFYADGTPGLVDASPNPPTSAAERFRLELVSLGEHLHQVVDGARGASEPAAKTRAQRDLRRALHSLHAAALSFGERDVAEFIAGHGDAITHLDFLGLASLEDLASILADPGAAGDRLSARLRDIAGGRDLSSAIGAGFGSEEPAHAEPEPRPAPAHRVSSPLIIPTPAIAAAIAEPVAPPAPVVAPPAPAPARAPAPAPAGPVPVPLNALDRTSASLIDASIAALDKLEVQPLVEPTPIAEDDIVPIDSLLYRGRAALDRAVELRDELRRAPSPLSAADQAALDELFDLLDLARVE
jgi:hypothetical protein